MLDESRINASYDKFKGFLEIKVKEESKKSDLLETIDRIDEIIKDDSLQNINKYKETFLVLCPDVSKYYDVIDFFTSKGALGIPQIDMACSSIIKKIKNSDFRHISEDDTLRYEGILNADYVKVDELNSILDETNLTEKEKIDVLVRNCYYSLSNVRSEERRMSIDKLSNRYMVALPVITELQNKYGFLVKGKSDKQIKYALDLGEMYENKQIGFKEMIESLKEIVMSFYLMIDKRNKEAKELINKSENGKLVLSDADILSETMDLLEHDIITFDHLIQMAHENKIKLDSDEEGVHLDR